MRYVSRPRAERWVRPGTDDDEDVMVPTSPHHPAAIEAIADTDPVWTGLYDARGDKIYSVKDPPGFRFTENE